MDDDLFQNFKMESTQKKIYEIEESAQIEQSIKNQIDQAASDGNKPSQANLADAAGLAGAQGTGKSHQDQDIYGDQFEENNEKAKEAQQNGVEAENAEPTVPPQQEKYFGQQKGAANDVGGPYSNKFMASHEGEADPGLPDPADLYIPVKTGTTVKHMKNPPYHLKTSFDFEPLYPPQEFILEESLRREADRIAYQENLMNRVVYDAIDPSPYQQAEAPEGEITPFYVPQGADDNTLLFESRFESGNLRRAIQVYEYEYDLILKPDYNTRGYTQWYYFRVSNTQAGKKYRFNIINLIKPDSLYNHGMRPLMYSEAAAKKAGRGWIRTGNDICYYQNSMKRKNAGYYYTLTWQCTMEYDKDTVYLAHSYPYTYTDMQRYLNMLEADPKRKNRMRRRTLCQTIAGNNCDMLVVTTFQSDHEAIKNRKGICISSRVHPGETGASWMMKGVLDYLTGSSLNAKILRDNFVFKIVPFLNPDGVINGNTRCNLAGVDLNRCWIDPSRKMQPTVYHYKMMVKKLQEDRDVFLVLDLHGHSRKKNIFCYGNSGRQNDRFKERIFPCLLDKNADLFSYEDCSFAVQKSKESTARVVMWKELGITNTFTCEASFCGADQGKFADYHFNQDLLQEMGHRIVDTILDFCDPDQVKVKAILEELEIMLPAGAAASDSESDDESEGDSDYSGDEDKEGKKKKKAAKGKKKKGKGDKKD